MQIKQIKNNIIDTLQDIYSKDELQSFARIISEHIIKKPYAYILANSDDVLDDYQQEEFANIINKLKQENPIQYILGEMEFYNINLFVEQGVLIPRNETEELVDWIIKDNQNKQDLNILDIGTGSGCIILSLSKALNPNSAKAVDVSNNALKIASKNANLNKLNIEFSKTNILNTKPSFFDKKFDIIVSNPPYVKESEKLLMKNNVLNYEPELALFVDDNNPLIFYDRIAKLASKILRPSGYLYFEINEALGKETVELIKKYGFADVVLRNDINDKPRMIRAKK